MGLFLSQGVTSVSHECVTFWFHRGAQDLSFHGADGKLIAEPGDFKLWVSNSSASGEEVTFRLLASGKRAGA